MVIDNNSQNPQLNFDSNFEKEIFRNIFIRSKFTKQAAGKQSADIISITEKFKCIIQSIDEAVKDSKVKDIWNGTKQQLGYVLERMKGCRTEQTIKDEIK